MTDALELGSVVGVFGVRGELRLHLHHRDSDLFDKARRALLRLPDGRVAEIQLKTRSGAGRRVLGAVQGLTDANIAGTLVGAALYVPATALPKLGPGEFYVAQLIGKPAYVDGVEVGRIVDVHRAGPTDVLELVTPEGQAFVPLIAAHIVKLDAAAGELHLTADSLVEG